MSHNKAHELEMKDEHYTPSWLFEKLGVTFEMDVAAPIGGVPWIPAKESFSQLDDGLSKTWIGSVWMNPPYSKPTDWVHKFLDHGNGIALLVVSRSKWFSRMWEECDAMAPTPYNLKFERPDGNTKQISFQTFLFACGADNVKALHNLERRVR
jgi:hypothetical protein